jgi:hypothetical protein
MGLWRAGCSATGTSGSAGGPGKRTSRKAGNAPRSDPTRLRKDTARPARSRPRRSPEPPSPPRPQSETHVMGPCYSAAEASCATHDADPCWQGRQLLWSESAMHIQHCHSHWTAQRKSAALTLRPVDSGQPRGSRRTSFSERGSECGLGLRARGERTAAGRPPCRLRPGPPDEFGSGPHRRIMTFACTLRADRPRPQRPPRPRPSCTGRRMPGQPWFSSAAWRSRERIRPS